MVIFCDASKHVMPHHARHINHALSWWDSDSLQHICLMNTDACKKHCRKTFVLFHNYFILCKMCRRLNEIIQQLLVSSSVVISQPDNPAATCADARRTTLLHVGRISRCRIRRRHQETIFRVEDQRLGIGDLLLDVVELTNQLQQPTINRRISLIFLHCIRQWHNQKLQPNVIMTQVT